MKTNKIEWSIIYEDGPSTYINTFSIDNLPLSALRAARLRRLIIIRSGIEYNRSQALPAKKRKTKSGKMKAQNVF